MSTKIKFDQLLETAFGIKEFSLNKLKRLALLQLNEALRILLLRLGTFIKSKVDFLVIYDGISNTNSSFQKFSECSSAIDRWTNLRSSYTCSSWAVKNFSSLKFVECFHFFF